MTVATEIVDLRQKLAALEEEFRGLVPDDGDQPVRSRVEGIANPPVASTLASSGEPQGNGKVVTRILLALAAEPGRSFRPDEIIKALGNVPGQSVRGTLARLVRDKRVDRPRRGRYRIKEGARA